MRDLILLKKLGHDITLMTISDYLYNNFIRKWLGLPAKFKCKKCGRRHEINKAIDGYICPLCRGKNF